MATNFSSGALPAMPTGLAGDPDAQTEYTQALQKVLSSLENRNKTNWFSVAGKLLQPGRTGNAYEGFGGAAEELGRQQEKQEEQEPSIAMMRAQLAGQKYQIKNEGKALEVLAGAIGTDPKTLSTQLSTGQLPPGAVSRITPEILATTEYLSPKVGSIVKNVFDMELKTKQAVTEDLKAGTSLIDLIAKYGKDKVMSTLNPASLPSSMQQQPTAPAPAATTMPVPAASTMSAPAAPLTNADIASNKSPMSGRNPQLQPDQAPVKTVGGRTLNEIIAIAKQNNIEHNRPFTKEMEDVFRRRFTDASADPVQPQPAPQRTQPAAASTVVSQNADENLPWSVQSEVAKSRLEKSDKPWQEKKDAIYEWDPDKIQSSTNRIREIHDIVDTKPHIAGILKKQGLLSAFANAAQEGVTLGQFGNISVPTEKFISTLNLKDTDQRDAARLATLLNQEFLERFKAYKSTLGPNISNADMSLGKASIVTPQDTADAIKHWSKHALVVNHQREALFNKALEFDNQYGQAIGPQKFFSSPHYTETVKLYQPLYDDLLKQSPLYKRP